MKKVLFVLAIAGASVIASSNTVFAQRHMISLDVVIGNRPPNPTEANLMRIEEQNHPNMEQAIQEVAHALAHLKQTPDDFGGHRAEAQNALGAAYTSLRKALYYRIYQDAH